MAGTGSPKLSVDGRGRRIAVVAASWHETVMDSLLSNAIDTLTAAGAEFEVVRVPGTFELPVACARLADMPRVAGGFDGFVALGVVIRGGTAHFEYVCQSAASGLTEVMVRTGKPIGFGVLTCDDDQQALDRAGLPNSLENKGQEAAEAVLVTLTNLDAVCGTDR